MPPRLSADAEAPRATHRCRSPALPLPSPSLAPGGSLLFGHLGCLTALSPLEESLDRADAVVESSRDKSRGGSSSRLSRYLPVRRLPRHVREDRTAIPSVDVPVLGAG